MRSTKIIVLLCVMALLLTMVGGLDTQAAKTDTVYVRKHISLVYDNSGSMSMDIGEDPNLKWSYASYAAQVFAGLLNESDSLSITFMNQTKSIKSLEVDLAADRQSQVDKLLDVTNYAKSGTPYQSVEDAKEVLVGKGLLSDAQIGNNQVSKSEQYWLVLTTDGNFNNMTAEETEAKLEEILKNYSNLQVVYFGIGTKGDQSDEAARDFRNSEKLKAYPNFSAVYAEKQEEIISTMQELANRISGRYSVSDGVVVNGNTVTLRISGETSPIRNVAMLAQNTDAKLLEAKTDEGRTLNIARHATIRYPQNDNYDCMPADTKGGYAALITSEEGKLAPGTVTLTFSEPVSKEDFSLMYEPAIYVDLTVQYQDSSGNWVDVPYGQKVHTGQTLRVGYVICEDGTDTPIDAAKLPGITTAQISCGDQTLSPNDTFSAPEGSNSIVATVSMMDGDYVISTVRNLQVISLSAYTYEISDSIEFYPQELENNTSLYLDFKVMYHGKPATADQLVDFQLDAGSLEGTLTTPETGVFRFTPKQAKCDTGDYAVELRFQGQSVASQTVRVKENVITCSATASDPIALFSNELAANTKALEFFVICSRNGEEIPLTEEMVKEFTIRAASADGTVLDGVTSYEENGIFRFVTDDNDAPAGDYAVTLYWKDQALAETGISVLQYNAQYTAEVFHIGENTVDRLNLEKNTNGLAFIIYADGEACTAVRLEAMLGQQISLEHTPVSSVMRLDVTVGAYEGKAAVIVVPTTTARTKFGAVLQKPGIAWGSMPAGELTVTLRVNAEKGTSVSAAMDVVNSFGEWLFWFLLLLIIVAAVVLIGWIILCNIRMHRICSGTFQYYRIDVVDYYVTVSYDPTYRHRWRPYFRLTWHPETVSFEGQTFVADKTSSSRMTVPMCQMDAEDPLLHSYYRQGGGSSARDLLRLLEEKGMNSFFKDDLEANLSTTPVFREDREPVDKYHYEKVDSGGYLMRRSQNVIEIWAYIQDAGNEKNNQ